MNQNIFCSKCYRIPSQCCCPHSKDLTGEEKDEIIAEFMGEYYKGDIVLHEMISAIARKAQEK